MGFWGLPIVPGLHNIEWVINVTHLYYVDLWRLWKCQPSAVRAVWASDELCIQCVGEGNLSRWHSVTTALCVTNLILFNAWRRDLKRSIETCLEYRLPVQFWDRKILKLSSVVCQLVIPHSPLPSVYWLNFDLQNALFSHPIWAFASQGQLEQSRLPRVSRIETGISCVLSDDVELLLAEPTSMTWQQVTMTLVGITVAWSLFTWISGRKTSWLGPSGPWIQMSSLRGLR
jgi:hypothetical protein